jgi:nucleotide-binding universal stress UspA family protein
MTSDNAPSAETAQSSTAAPQQAIVVGVDGSENADRAMLWAAAEAEQRGTTLTLVHALHLPGAAGLPLEPPEYAQRRRSAGRALLDEAAAAVRSRHPQLALDLELSDLDPAHTLTEFSREAVLVVSGTRGHGGYTGMLLGSVSRKLAAHVHCPLVVVHGEAAREVADRVILGVGPKHSPAAARYAFEAARRTGATLQAVHVFAPNTLYTGMAGVGVMRTGHPEADRRRAVEEAESAVEPLRKEFPEVPVQVSAHAGNTVDILIATARDARLLVVCAHRRRGPLSAGVGYVVDGVLSHSQTPVAVVPDD